MPETQTAASGTLRIHRHNENQQCGSRSTHTSAVDEAVLCPTATCKCGQLLLLAGNAVTISVTEGVGAIKLLRDDKVCYWSGAASDVVDGSWSTNTVRVDGVHVRAVREHLGGWCRGGPGGPGAVEPPCWRRPGRLLLSPRRPGQQQLSRQSPGRPPLSPPRPGPQQLSPQRPGRLLLWPQRPGQQQLLWVVDCLTLWRLMPANW